MPVEEDQGRSGVGYAEVLRLDRARRTLALGSTAKLSLAMVSLSLLLCIQDTTHRVLEAGLVAGAFGLGNVLVAPLRARIVDLCGARRALGALGLSYCLGLIALLICAVLGILGWPLTVLAAAAGAVAPPVGAVVRGSWARIAPTDRHRLRAYSLDAVVEELVFVLGPLLVGAVALLPQGPKASLLLTALLGLVGTLGVALGCPHREIASDGGALSWQRIAGPLRLPAFWPVLLALCAIGVVLGASELLSTAVGTALGPSGPGVFLAVFAAGSVAGGAVYGARDWRAPATHRMLLLGLGAVLLLLVTSWTGSLLLLLGLFAAMGLFVAPTLVTGYLVADDVAPLRERTEASALVNTAANAGAALALSLGGAWLEAGSPGGTALRLAGGALAVLAAAALVAAGLARGQGAAPAGSRHQRGLTR